MNRQVKKNYWGLSLAIVGLCALTGYQLFVTAPEHYRPADYFVQSLGYPQRVVFNQDSSRCWISTADFASGIAGRLIGYETTKWKLLAKFKLTSWDVHLGEGNRLICPLDTSSSYKKLGNKNVPGFVHIRNIENGKLVRNIARPVPVLGFDTSPDSRYWLNPTVKNSWEVTDINGKIVGPPLHGAELFLSHFSRDSRWFFTSPMRNIKIKGGLWRTDFWNRQLPDRRFQTLAYGPETDTFIGKVGGASIGIWKPNSKEWRTQTTNLVAVNNVASLPGAIVVSGTRRRFSFLHLKQGGFISEPILQIRDATGKQVLGEYFEVRLSYIGRSDSALALFNKKKQQWTLIDARGQVIDRLSAATDAIGEVLASDDTSTAPRGWFSPDMRWFLSTSNSGLVHIWKLPGRGKS